MAPKQKKPVDLTAFQPTAEELAAARQILSNVDRKGFKAKDNAMRQFVLSNCTDDNKKALSTAGTERQEYIAR